MQQGRDLLHKLSNKTKGFESFCSASGKSNDTSDTSQLLIVIRGITESYDVAKELAYLKRLCSRTRRGDLILSVCENVKELELP
jgi:hypothetical protein